MEDESLGSVIGVFRTSRIQAIILFVLAVVLAGLSGWMMNWDKNIGTPFCIVGIPASLCLVVWGLRLTIPSLEVREHGVRLRLLFRRLEIPYSQLVSIQRIVRTVNGLPQSAKAIVFNCADGSRVTFPLESNVEEACNQIIQRCADPATPHQA